MDEIRMVAAATEEDPKVRTVAAATTEARTVEVVTAEIVTISRQMGAIMLQGAIEIGRRLWEVKELIPHGEWGRYLTERVSLSTSSANNFMRIYKEYGDQQVSLFDVGGEAKSQTFGNLSYSKALELLALPEGERAEFVQSHDVEEMSTRELREAIRERDEARREAEAARADKATAEESVETMRRDMELANEQVELLKGELEELRSRPVEVAVEKDQAAVDQARKEGREAAEKKLAAKLQKAEQAAKDAQEKLKKAEERLTSGEDKYKLQVAEAQREAERLRKELAASGSAVVTRFGVHFQRVQEDLEALKECIRELEEAGDTENRDKLGKAFRALMERYG